MDLHQRRLLAAAQEWLARLAAGVPRVVAIFGVQSWRWDWIRKVREMLEPAAYGGYKDVSAAWVAGVLTVGAGPAPAATGGEVLAIPKNLRESWTKRVAIMAADGGLACEEAERLAWEWLQASGAAP